MNEIPVTNTTDSNLHVGGKVLRPGVTRLIDERLVPDHLKPGAPAEEPAKEPDPDPIATLLAGPIPDVVAGLEALTNDQLDALELAEMDQENGGKNRKGVFEAVAELRLHRAQP